MLPRNPSLVVSVAIRSSIGFESGSPVKEGSFVQRKSSLNHDSQNDETADKAAEDRGRQADKEDQKQFLSFFRFLRLILSSC